jgi:hypothetical protein
MKSVTANGDRSRRFNLAEDERQRLAQENPADRVPRALPADYAVAWLHSRPGIGWSEAGHS